MTMSPISLWKICFIRDNWFFVNSNISYRSESLFFICYLSIVSQQSKGKIEKFHQVVDDFIRESKLKDIKSLNELNRLWEIFADEYYHKKPHEGISEYYESLGAAVPKEGITPLQE